MASVVCCLCGLECGYGVCILLYKWQAGHLLRVAGSLLMRTGDTL